MRYFKPHFKIQTPFRPPFGSCISNRGFSSAAYRFGFNNQEKDGELGASYAFEYRIHDARLGRFLSVDPLAAKFPFYSSYQFCSNSPLAGVEIEGLESSVTGQNISENLEVLDEGKSGYPKSQNDLDQVETTSSKTSITRGKITYSGPGIQSRIEDAINPTKDVRRGFFGRLLYKNNMKTIDNPKFEPAIAMAIEDGLSKGYNIYFSDDASDLKGSTIVTNGIIPTGVCFKTGDNNYTLFASKESGTVEKLESAGTDPIFEEIFHMENYINKEISLTSENLVPADSRLNDEALAKYKVVSKIRNLTQNYYHIISVSPGNSGDIYTALYVHTSFGAMSGMSAAAIKEFISTNKGKEHDYDVYEITYDSFGIQSANQKIVNGQPITRTSTKPQEGMYDFLR